VEVEPLGKVSQILARFFVYKGSSLEPQVCANLASDLKNSREMYASQEQKKKKKKEKKWKTGKA